METKLKPLFILNPSNDELVVMVDRYSKHMVHSIHIDIKKQLSAKSKNKGIIKNSIKYWRYSNNKNIVNM